jgi:hypothetical protein
VLNPSGCAEDTMRCIVARTHGDASALARGEGEGEGDQLPSVKRRYIDSVQSLVTGCGQQPCVLAQQAAHARMLTFSN